MRSRVLLFVLTLSLAASLSRSSDWPHWRGPNHDGISLEAIPENLPESLPIAWKAKVGIGFCTVSVVGNRVLTMGNQDDRDTVWCLDAESGEVLWKHTYDCPLDPLYYEGGPGGTPTVHEGSVYTLSKKGHAFRLDLETGKVIWERDLLADHEFALPEWSFACSPYIDGDRVLLNVGRGGLALSRETGETLWMPSTETSGYATVVPFPGGESAASHLLFSAKALIALDSSSGKEIWSYPWKSSRDVNAADPVVVGDRIVVSSSAGTEMLIPGSGGSEPTVSWKQHDLKWYFNPGVKIGNHLYSLHGTTHRPTELICTDVETGETIWSEEGFGSGGLKAAGEIVIVFDLGKLTLFRATPEGFTPLLQQQVLEGKCWTSPVFSNGRIYCRNAAGDLAVVEVVSK
ncbi:MAG: PQQ-like beta-propeller repeat protein [Verrucomicrobiales bacterium]|nr:PQQ-like beta-propeller repeat protein [Verrucomicrobiales bacterium]